MKKIMLLMTFVCVFFLTGCGNYSMGKEVNIKTEKIIYKVNSYKVVDVNEVLSQGKYLALNVSVTNNTDQTIRYFNVGTLLLKPSKDAKVEDSYVDTTILTDAIGEIEPGKTETGNIYFNVDHYEEGMVLEITANSAYSDPIHADKYKYYIDIK